MIKQHAEKRSTRSWDTSIFNSVYQVNKVNKRRKSGGYYLAEHEIEDAIKESYTVALKHASLEVFEGMYDDRQLSGMIDSSSIMEEALELVLKGRH